MKKVELLSPVGDYKTVKFAVFNGADAIYLGGKKFGARNYADNFNFDELKEVVQFCHLYGVKVYVTVNTIIYETEIDEFINYVDFLYRNNVDALIMQDLGMILKVRSLFPDFEIHSSTQMHNHNNEGVKLLKKLGIKRVVLARELSIDEINNINCDIEKEVFVHGALCVCYSGCCLFSALKSNRSGNRGECIAYCRLRYNLYEDDNKVNTSGKYLLSTKELNTVNHIDKLIESGIDSLKIEGRMKSPEYVGLITRVYREAIDSYYRGCKFSISEELLKKMKVLYNREYTKGYLFGDYGKSLMNIKTPNHQGVSLGEVIELNKKIIKIKLNEDLSQEDGIRFLNENKGMIVNKLYDSNYKLINRVLKGSIAIVDNKIGLTKKSKVNKTIDIELVKSISNFPNNKISIDIRVVLTKNKPIFLELKDSDGNVVSEEGALVEEAINVPICEDSIKKQINRLGDTPFVLRKIEIFVDDGVFVQNSCLNAVRRRAVDKLIYIRKTKKPSRRTEMLTLEKVDIKKDKFNINVLVRTEEQLKAALDKNVDNIYITDFNLYKKYKDKNIYYVLPRVISKYKDYKNENLLIRELGSVFKYAKDNNVVSDYTLNVVNSESVKLLNFLGVRRVCYSPEVNLGNLKRIDCNTEIVVYGKIELMVVKYCLLNMLINDDNKKCFLCRNNKNYYLKDEKDNKYPLKHDNCITTIFDSNKLDIIDKKKNISKCINNLRINLFDENYQETQYLIDRVRG